MKNLIMKILCGSRSLYVILVNIDELIYLQPAQGG